MPRAAGQRSAYADLPADVTAWVERVLGSPVVEVLPQQGGFSPGPAVRLRCADGARAFLKAVGDDVNADTPDLFRHEAAVLSALPPVPYRAGLLAAFDDGHWVALLLDDVEGRHPDLDDERDLAAVREAVISQSAELTPDPLGLRVPDLAEGAARWARRTARALERDPSHFPAWFVAESEALLARLGSLPDRLPPESWIHLDVRDDNVLVRPDGSAVLVDWGMSRSGPSWTDQVLLGLHHVDAPRFDEDLAEVRAWGTSAARGDALQDDITDLVLALGSSLAALRDRPVPGLPAIDEFRRRESARILEGARRRLGL